MPLRDYPGMDDCNHANRLHAISPAVLAADHSIHIPPSSPDRSGMLPPRTLQSKETEMRQEKDGSDIRGHLMDLADGFPLVSLFSLGVVSIIWVHGYPLGICLLFVFMLFVCSFGFG